MTQTLESCSESSPTQLLSGPTKREPYRPSYLILEDVVFGRQLQILLASKLIVAKKKYIPESVVPFVPRIEAWW